MPRQSHMLYKVNCRTGSTDEVYMYSISMQRGPCIHTERTWMRASGTDMMISKMQVHKWHCNIDIAINIGVLKGY